MIYPCLLSRSSCSQYPSYCCHQRNILRIIQLSRQIAEKQISELQLTPKESFSDDELLKKLEKFHNIRKPQYWRSSGEARNY